MCAQEAKYKAVIHWVRDCIQSGEFQMGEKLPSENELSMKFGLSRQTVRHAIDVLEREKLVTRVQGSGTYVGTMMMPARQERFMNIAVISTYVDSYIFPPVLKGIERELSKAGYTVQVAFTGNAVQREMEILDKLLEKGYIDGLIVEPSKSALPNPNLHYYRRLMEEHIPILFFNSKYPALNLPCVSMDDEKIGREAARCLISAGHRNIGGIFKCDDGQGHLRYAGFVDAFVEAGIKVDSRHLIWIDTVDMKDMEFWSDYLFRRLEGCTGVVCYNDEVAHLMTGFCQRRGIAIPRDLSIVGIDDSDLAGIGDIQWNSFAHPMEKLGRKAAENMIHMIENPYFVGSYQFESGMTDRGSVRILNGEEI